MHHPWHDVSYGKDAPENVTAVIEIPKISRAKYELDKASGYLKLDRVLYSSVYYPFNYGFIPRTFCDDDDPLDILVLCSVEIAPLCLVNAKVIGVMRMLDGGEADDKIIAVADNDMSVAHFDNIEELPRHYTREMEAFFEDYKRLEKKEVKVEKFQDRDVAIEIVKKSIVDYNEKILPTLNAY